MTTEKEDARQVLRLGRRIVWQALRGHIDEVEKLVAELRKVTTRREKDEP